MLIENFRALSTIQFSSYNYYFGNYKCISLLLLPPLEHTTIKFTFLKYNFQQVVVMLVNQSCPTLCDPMDCSRLGSVHGILQARILEWVVILFSRGSSWSRDRTQVSGTIGRFFTVRATREAQLSTNSSSNQILWMPPPRLKIKLKLIILEFSMLHHFLSAYLWILPWRKLLGQTMLFPDTLCIFTSFLF